MTTIPFTPPQFQVNGFNCPYCLAFSSQRWGQPQLIASGNGYGQSKKYWMCRCDRCGEWSFWVDGSLHYPLSSSAPHPNPDMPVDIIEDFKEARVVLPHSPRGASALLRLCIQKLCKHLGEPGKNINDDIASLVKKGLSPKIQQALDIVRVVGNNAVHPGQLDLTDDINTANQLFGLVNLIAETLISQPKHIESLYTNLVPNSQRDAIQKRDQA